MNKKRKPSKLDLENALKKNFKGHEVSRNEYLFEDPNFYLLSNGAGTPVVQWASQNAYTINSAFLTVNYAYSDKYLVTATVRQDNTSRFARENANAIFPSGSFGWVISEEDFFNSDNYMKLRVSYGTLGNQSLGRTAPDQNVSSLSEANAYYPFNGSNATTGAALSAVGNPDLKWETVVSQNLGLDLKGGMNVTLEVMVVDVLKALSNNSTDELFNPGSLFKQILLGNSCHGKLMIEHRKTVDDDAADRVLAGGQGHVRLIRRGDPTFTNVSHDIEHLVLIGCHIGQPFFSNQNLLGIMDTLTVGVNTVSQGIHRNGPTDEIGFEPIVMGNVEKHVFFVTSTLQRLHGDVCRWACELFMLNNLAVDRFLYMRQRHITDTPQCQTDGQHKQHGQANLPGHTGIG